MDLNQLLLEKSIPFTDKIKSNLKKSVLLGMKTSKNTILT